MSGKFKEIFLTTVPIVNMLILLVLVATLTYLTLRNSSLLSVRHDILEYDLQPKEFKHGATPYIVRFNSLVKREGPEECRLIIERTLLEDHPHNSDMSPNGVVIYSTITPGNAKANATTRVRTNWRLPDDLAVGCYAVITRAITDCGLRTLIRQSPEIKICVKQ